MDGQTQPISLRPRYVHLRNWCIACVITAAGVIAAYIWLDRPIAFFIDRTVVDKTLFVWLQRLPIALLLLSLLVLVWCGLWTLMERPFLRVQSVGLACSISFIAANFISNQLKYALGRTWPDTWIQNNPSLIQNGVFGFNPFHGGPGFASFPSGHVAAVCAAITVLWWSYRRLRPIYLVFVAAVAIGLIGANYHFLSDILGGIFVGTSVGYITREIARGKLISEFSPSNTTTPLGGNQRTDVAPRADTNQQISIPRNVTDVIFELAAARAFDGARRDLHEEAQAFDRGDHVRINMGRDRQG